MSGIVGYVLIVLAFAGTILAVLGNTKKQQASGRASLTSKGITAILVGAAVMFGTIYQFYVSQKEAEFARERLADTLKLLKTAQADVQDVPRVVFDQTVRFGAGSPLV